MGLAYRRKYVKIWDRAWGGLALSLSASKLLVLDIDNTVFDWVSYYVQCMEALAAEVQRITGIPRLTLFQEAREVFAREGSIEYPFLIQELPSINAFYGENVELMLKEAVQSGRLAFNQKAQSCLKPYQGVLETMAEIRQRYPQLPIIALTDAPRYVAMWKLNKLGLLPYFSAVYGLPDPRIPVAPESRKVKVDPEILMKHLEQRNFDFRGRVRELPEDYEKPGTKGLKTVLMDYEMESHRRDVFWIGDNLRKDIGLGKNLGVHTAWAEYGTKISSSAKEALLLFSPVQNVHKNVALDPQSDNSPKPDVVLQDFSEILAAIPHILFPS